MSDMLYKVPGRHKGPKGTTFDYCSTDGGKPPKGWHKSLDAAIKASLPKKAATKEEKD